MIITNTITEICNIMDNFFKKIEIYRTNIKDTGMFVLSRKSK